MNTLHIQFTDKQGVTCTAIPVTQLDDHCVMSGVRIKNKLYGIHTKDKATEIINTIRDNEDDADSIIAAWHEYNFIIGDHPVNSVVPASVIEQVYEMICQVRTTLGID